MSSLFSTTLKRSRLLFPSVKSSLPLNIFPISSRFLTQNSSCISNPNLIYFGYQKRNLNQDPHGRPIPRKGQSIISAVSEQHMQSAQEMTPGALFNPDPVEQAPDNLPWGPTEMQAEKPPYGYTSIDGFFDGDIQVDGKRYNHSIICLPQTVIGWNVSKLEDITGASLVLPAIHYPSIRHIFIGVGYTLPCPTDPEWISYLEQFKVTCEIVTLVTAARLFQMQNTLYQNFACALLYDKTVTMRLHNLAKKIELGIVDPLAHLDSDII